jgi:hypothetical protein
MTSNTDHGASRRKESEMDFTSIPSGCLEEGTETPLGVIQGASLTAYYIEDRWVPFSVIHGKPKWAESLTGLIPQSAVDKTREMANSFSEQSAANIRNMIAGQG